MQINNPINNQNSQLLEFAFLQKLFKYNPVDEEAIFPLQSSIFCLTGGRDYGLLGS